MRGISFLSAIAFCASFSSATSYNALFAGDSDVVVHVENNRTSGGGEALEAFATANSDATIGVNAQATWIAVHAIAQDGPTDVKRAYYGKAMNGSTANFGAYLDSYGGPESYGAAGFSWSGDVSYGLYGLGYGTTGYGVYGSGSTYAGYFDGDVVVTGTFSNPSDLALKKNVRSLDNALDKVMSLKPKTYEMATDKYANIRLSKGSKFGLIAQDVEAVMPELVHPFKAPARLANGSPTKKEGTAVELKSVDYISLIPVLVKGMQEQQATITTLQAKIAKLENR